MAQAKCWKWDESCNRFIYDYKKKLLGIPRARRRFRTEEEAEYFHKSVLRKYLGIGAESHNIHLFGEALAEYLDTVSAKQRSHADNLSNAGALRWPYQYKGRFHRLEELPLNDSEHGILVGMNRWLEDQHKVIRRVYINRELYQLRSEVHGQTWYHQPNPADTKGAPKERTPVLSQRLLQQLKKAKGRGGFSADTLRLRQQLAASVLTAAYNKWRWTEKNLADFVDRIEGHEGHNRKLDAQQFNTLIDQASTHYGEMYALLIIGGVRIGWRRSNLTGLTWNRVIWPEGDQPGYLFIPKTRNAVFNPHDKSQRRERTKNGHELITVLDDETEQLLRRLYELRHPDSDVVFHDSHGHYWGECRKRWDKVKQLAGIEPDFRWHDLRHTWASDLVNAGIDGKTIMEQQGWKDPRMVDRYGHKDLTTRRNAISRRTS